MKKIISISEASRLTGFSPMHLYRMIDSGKIKPAKREIAGIYLMDIKKIQKLRKRAKKKLDNVTIIP